MKIKSLENAIKKAGYTINQSRFNNNFYIVKGQYNTVSYYHQDDIAVCVKIQANGTQDDAMSDMFYGFFAKTIKEVIKYLNEGK